MVDPSKIHNKKEIEAFSKFLQSRKILIADSSPSSRSGIYSVFRRLGADENQIIFCSSFEEAETEITRQRPHIVVSEYDLGKRCGLDLLQNQREQRPNENRNSLFVIVTTNSSQSSVAKAAEEDIDAYIIKPYTADMVRKTLLKAALAKILPSKYSNSIEAGKKALYAEKYDEAVKAFQEALTQNPSPALACYYLGVLNAAKRQTEEARSWFVKGLKYNKIHYKCMVGLYELMMNEKEFSEAYDTLKRITQYFPVTPKRLTDVLRLAIVNGKYEDIERYYTIFNAIDEKNDQLIKYVCAALVVCGKYYLGVNMGHNRALQLFQKAAETGSGRGKILKEIVLVLIEQKLVKDAWNFLNKMPATAKNTNDFQLLRFLIMNAEGSDMALIDHGRKLIANGIVDERLYTAMIVRAREAGLLVAADTALQAAIRNLPEKRAFFEDLFNKIKPIAKKEPAEEKTEEKSSAG